MKITSNIKRILKKIITGLTLPQEYVCVDKVSLAQTFQVFFITEDALIDVTHTHLFLGYKPLIIGLPAHVLDTGVLSFRTSSGREVATLHLRKVTQLESAGNTLALFEGVSGKHSFLGGFHHWVNESIDRFKKKKAGNVTLDGNLYDQVRIAYSIPRIISVISVSDGEKMNLFPTDLHGVAGSDLYVGSLRIAGLANAQVEEYGRIVVSEMPAAASGEVYSLGSNHMKPLREAGNFRLSHDLSKVFGFPLPEGVVRYRELQRIDFKDIGIHRIHLYRVVSDERMSVSGGLLSHIHNYYAQWRIDQHLPLEKLIRPKA